jgi:hypothetical protein
VPPLVIITGAGHHSDAHKARIRPAVVALLTQRGAQFRASAGDVTVLSL